MKLLEAFGLVCKALPVAGRSPSPRASAGASGCQEGWAITLRVQVPNYRVFRVSILGIVSTVLGRYFIVRYVDP